MRGPKRWRVGHESTDCEQMPVFDIEVQGSPNTKKMRADEQASHASESWDLCLRLLALI